MKQIKKMKQSVQKEYEEGNYWGLSSSIDLHSCNASTIRSEEEIKKFVIELCNLIEMKRYGECVVINFGEDPKVAGFSMTQLIETSLISAHFANQSNNVYLDVFSCKYYDPEVVAEFAKKYFEAQSCNMKYALRK